MDDMLFQYDDARATFGSRGIIVCVLPAQNIMPGEVCCVAAKYDAVARFTRPDAERLEEFVLHGDIIPHFSPSQPVIFYAICLTLKNEGGLCYVSKGVDKYLL